jgi:hypothetical protein
MFCELSLVGKIQPFGPPCRDIVFYSTGLQGHHKIINLMPYLNASSFRAGIFEDLLQL